MPLFYLKPKGKGSKHEAANVYQSKEENYPELDEVGQIKIQTRSKLY